MKKITVLLCAAMISLGILTVPSAARAAEVKLGVEMMYAWWKPAFLKMEQETAAKFFGYKLSENNDGTFMMGPMMWAQINPKWSVEFKALFGLTRNEFEHTTWAMDSTLWTLLGGGLFNTYFDIGDSKARRYDLDLKFGYAMHKYIDLLIGARFNYNNGDGTAFRLLGFDYKKEEFSSWYLGPSLGIGGHFEIKGFSFGLGTSFITQFGTYNLKKTLFLEFIPLSIVLPYKYDVGYISFGLDSSLRLAYLIAPIHLEVFVGGRYVFLGHASVSDDGSILDISYKKGWIGGKFDHFGGINFGVAYKF